MIPFLFAKICLKVHLLALQVLGGVSSWRVPVSRDGDKVSLNDGDLLCQSSDRECRRRQLGQTFILLLHQRM